MKIYKQGTKKAYHLLHVVSQVALDESGLEDLPSLPGRALFKTDCTEEIQVPFLKEGVAKL
ncbi:hypothetical protein COK78_32920, partial [Bacillus thuringiensis]